VTPSLGLRYHSARDSLRRYLATNQLKSTRQREQILEVFIEAGGHVGADDLREILDARGMQVGLATIYRTLALFRDAGLAREHQFGDGHARYEARDPLAEHDHLVCTRCGRIVEFSEPGIRELEQKVADRAKFKLVQHRLELRGICPTCASEAEAAEGEGRSSPRPRSSGVSG